MEWSQSGIKQGHFISPVSCFSIIRRYPLRPITRERSLFRSIFSENWNDSEKNVHPFHSLILFRIILVSLISPESAPHEDKIKSRIIKAEAILNLVIIYNIPLCFII
jgi:hypothetical protein